MSSSVCFSTTDRTRLSVGFPRLLFVKPSLQPDSERQLGVQLIVKVWQLLFNARPRVTARSCEEWLR